MSKIILLEESVINKIAAGEVIERPSNVVKELVENAIDAGAGAITVELKEGGFKLIRITDNGAGINKEDIRNAFLRHATSKISRVEDLQSINSLGFRGEALASIAAVSQVELLTKVPGELMGSRYIIEGGVECPAGHSEGNFIEDVGCPEGTTLLVRNLFYNTPARKKFMKTPQTEAGYIGDMLQCLAMSHPAVSFQFIHNGQGKFRTTGNGNIKDVIYSIFGRDIASNLCKIHQMKALGDEQMELSGYCGKPVISRGNRNLEIYFINGRYIKNSAVGRAVEDAYKPYMMARKYPFTALYLNIPQYLVDVNVHPSKMEAQFANREEVYQFIYKAVSEALSARELIPEVSIEKAKKNSDKKISGKKAAEKIDTDRLPMKKDKISEDILSVKRLGKPEMERPAEPFEKKRLQDEKERVKKQLEVMDQAFGSGDILREKAADYPVKPMPPQVKAGQQAELFDMPLLSEQSKKHHRIIGEVFSTYWLVEFAEKLFIIDQHAAHEKVLYERKLKAFEQKEHMFSQQIAPPVILSLSQAEQEILREQEDFLTRFGFEIEPFGGNEFALRAVPADMVEIADADMFLEFLESLGRGQKTPEFILERLASMSCKAAVKGGNTLSVKEAHKLIDELLELENPYHCPHGRPTIISMSKYEMEKKFKRTGV